MVVWRREATSKKWLPCHGPMTLGVAQSAADRDRLWCHRPCMRCPRGRGGGGLSGLVALQPTIPYLKGANQRKPRSEMKQWHTQTSTPPKRPEVLPHGRGCAGNGPLDVYGHMYREMQTLDVYGHMYREMQTLDVYGHMYREMQTLDVYGHMYREMQTLDVYGHMYREMQTLDVYGHMYREMQTLDVYGHMYREMQTLDVYGHMYREMQTLTSQQSADQAMKSICGNNKYKDAVCMRETPSKLDGNFLSIQQPSTSLHEIAATIQKAPRNDSNHPERSQRWTVPPIGG